MHDSCPAIYFSLFTTFRIATERLGLRESLVIRRVDLDNDTKSYIDNVEKYNDGICYIQWS